MAALRMTPNKEGDGPLYTTWTSISILLNGSLLWDGCSDGRQLGGVHDPHDLADALIVGFYGGEGDGGAVASDENGRVVVGFEPGEGDAAPEVAGKGGDEPGYMLAADDGSACGVGDSAAVGEGDDVGGEEGFEDSGVAQLRGGDEGGEEPMLFGFG